MTVDGLKRWGRDDYFQDMTVMAFSVPFVLELVSAIGFSSCLRHDQVMGRIRGIANLSNTKTRKYRPLF